MTSPREDYKEEFGKDEEVPTAYFAGRKGLREAVDQAIERGEPYTHREWLKVAGYTEEQIEKIINGDLLI